MAIGTGDAVVKTGATQKTLEASGAVIANGAYVKATTGYSRLSDGNDAPDAKIALGVTFGTAPAAGKALILFARKLNVDGANDAPVPSANYQETLIGSVIVDAVTTTQYLETVVEDVPAEFDLYIRNDTGQSVSAGWTAKITPQTYGPAA